MSETRVPPQNVDAERAVLGASMLSRDALVRARQLLKDEDWYQPRHQLIWSTINGLYEDDEPVDALTVGAALMAAGKAGTHSQGLAYLHQLISEVITAGNAGYYAEMVATAAKQRRLIYAVEKTVQRAYEASEGKSAATIGELVSDLIDDLSLVEHPDMAGPINGLLPWHDFFATYAGIDSNWVVPDTIGRKDVWMVLAPPGAGKSTLTRMICWCVAAGMHPFDPDLPIAPKTTLVVDLENDEGMVADESIHHFGRLDSMGRGVGDRGWIWSRPQGINLRKADDMVLFDRVLTQIKPDLVGFGSLTNSFIRTGDWDQVAGEIRDVLNKLRVKHQFALWIEHHMPKAGENGRRRTPIGSQIFESWPSHGRVLERLDDDMKDSPYTFRASFRGDRGKRKMPVAFNRGGRLPWEPIWNEADLDAWLESNPKK